MLWDDDFNLDDGPRDPYYINSVCTTPPEQNVGSLPWYELAAGSHDEAQDLVDSTRAIGGDSLFTYYEENETEKYYEFYVNEDHAFRVHKLNYYEPLINFLNVTTDTMGIYRGQMTEDKAKDLAEYLFYRGKLKDGWFSTHFHKVLNSSIESTSQYYLCTIKSLTLAIGDWDLRDQITVYKNYIKVLRNDGSVLYSKDTVKVIYGTQR
jgi:hypothetical protein